MEDASSKSKLFISAEILNFYLYGKNHVGGGEQSLRLPVFTPPQLSVQASTIPGSDYGVYSTTWIYPGTLFGPITGRTIPVCERLSRKDRRYSWEVINQDGHVVHNVAVDMTSWTAHVVCARYQREQNLILIQRNNQLYYEAIKLIHPGEELLVWYGPEYKLFMGIPDPEQPESVVKPSGDGQIAGADKCNPSAKFFCVICRRPFNSRSNLRSHMRIHTLERPFSCTFCQRAFSQSSTLRNHIRLHTGEKPYQCTSCHRFYSQLAGLRAHQKSSRHRHPVTSSNGNQ